MRRAFAHDRQQSPDTVEIRFRCHWGLRPSLEAQRSNLDEIASSLRSSQ
jgi:hypothetical protein